MLVCFKTNSLNSFWTFEKHLLSSSLDLWFFIVVETNSEVEETALGAFLSFGAPCMVCWKVDVSHASDSLLIVVFSPTYLLESCSVAACQNARISETFFTFGLRKDIMIFQKH